MVKKILYIEDNPQNMRLVGKMMKMTDYTLLEAIDGMSGLEVARKEMPDLILLDINLPDIDGLQVLKQLKDDPKMSHIPVVALTASIGVGDEARFIDAGCVGYVAKPVSRTELLETVSEFLKILDDNGG